MEEISLDEEIRRLLDRWNRSILDKDAAAAAELREDGYTAALPGGGVLTKEEEVALLASPKQTVESIRVRNLEVRREAGGVTAAFDNLIEGEFLGEPVKAVYKYTITFRKKGDAWRAQSSSLVLKDGATARAAAGGPESARGRAGRTLSLRNLVPGALKSWAKGRLKSVVAEDAPTFPELAYFPYRPGLDFVLPPDGARDADAESSELPVPPEELWLGYNYPAHGAAHVARMLEIVYASGFSFQKGDRVLDLGCGAGRMIRHLKDLSETCEIWGTDISAEHIYWCQRHLSPPFNFATTTKVPHLPFEDRSFRLIYCGSVFTHIDDLADAWLLELRRVLAPDGRLYLTIHDDHTVALFESGKYDSAEIVRRIRSSETYQQAKDSFGMFTVGRGAGSQVFYDAAYFSKTVRPAFDILSVTREAYFYQTAFLLQRK